jgi:hypothetical protein
MPLLVALTGRRGVGGGLTAEVCESADGAAGGPVDAGDPSGVVSGPIRRGQHVEYVLEASRSVGGHLARGPRETV